MLPDEVAALWRADERSARSAMIVAIVAVLCAVLPVTLYVLTVDIAVDHILGRTEQVQARVESVAVEGPCKRRSVDRYQVELTWSIDGAPGRGSYSTCGNEPAVGETIDAWVSASGQVTPGSPPAPGSAWPASASSWAVVPPRASSPRPSRSN